MKNVFLVLLVLSIIVAGCSPKQEVEQPEVVLVELTFQPMQCVDTPWDVWYASGETQFVTQPSDEELIQAYYSSKNVEVKGIIRIDTNEVQCDACEICATSHFFTTKTTEESLQTLLDDGWTQ